jgi:penicillin-binding protein 1B
LSQGDKVNVKWSILSKVRQSSAIRIYCFAGGIALGTAFGIYLWSLYGQLTVAFGHEDQLVPNRIYSDVSRLVPLQPRTHIEDRLKLMGYTFPPEANTIHFALHPIDYPVYLLPNNHPQMEIKDPSVDLTFEGPGKNALLKSIQMGGREIPDVYLEPELVATLSRSGDARREIRTYLKFDEIPAPIWKAIIAVEDQHFLEHKGLDPRGMARAIWVNFKTLSLAQGGSTITQQLVKNLMVRRTKNLFRKANELFLSLMLEARFEKEQILERYLNEVYLGQVGNIEIHGVAEGAEHFFGKKLEDLNLGETALMAGLIRGPGFYSPYRYRERALERQRLVLRKMVETGQIAEQEAQEAMKLPIRLAPPQTSSNKAPFFTDYVKAELVRQLKDRMAEAEITKAGFRVYTTLDTSLNTAAQRAVAEGTASLETRLKLPPDQRLEGALASVDPTNGYIRALVGGRNYALSNFNRILNMKRQVGSTFKPIVYLTAFAKGEDAKGIPYGPAHPAEDAPWTLKFDRGRQSWSPKNYEKEHMGWISYRTALAHSVNTIAAKLGDEVGIDEVIKTGHTLGVESVLPSVPSLALGVAEMSPIELLRVYATLANRGVQDELTVIRGITQTDGTGYARFVYHPKQVFDPAPIDLLTDTMQSVFTEGTAHAALKMGFNRAAAGKTGTTSNHRDAWFAGYTPQLATVVWVGMDQTSDKNMKPLNLTGANSALPIWVNYMKSALVGEPPAPFPISPLLEELPTDRFTGKKAKSNCSPSQVILERFIRTHEPHDDSCESSWPTP